MDDGLSLSIFTVEVDRKPILAVQFKWHSEAESILSDTTLLDQLRLLKSEGRYLCDDFSIFRVRIARPAEKQSYLENAATLLTGAG